MVSRRRGQQRSAAPETAEPGRPAAPETAEPGRPETGEPATVTPDPSGAVERLLATLDADQREVATHPAGPMCVLAGAGTGKTRALTHRIAYGVTAGIYPPQGVLAVTFTARAAGEMRSRLRALGVPAVSARTFHAAALRQLHYFWPQAIGGAAPPVAPHKAALVAEAAARLRLRLDRAGVRDVSAEIEWAKVSLLTEDSYVQAADTARRDPAGLGTLAMARLLRSYEDVKTSRGVIDFEDVLLLTVGILADRPDIADQVRRQYRYFVVDEYQDVNQLQQRLLELWVGDRHDVCVVGDPSQTIYSFTGASAEHLQTFARRHPGTRTVQLTTNYRSTPQVVAVANTLLSAPGVQRQGVRLVARSASGPRPEFTVYPDDDAEAAGVATSIARLIAAGTDPGHIAVLFRTNAQSAAFEAALSAAGIGYLVRGGERFFARAEVRQAMMLLRAATKGDHGDRSLAEATADVLAGMGWNSTPPSSGASRERWESLSALVALAGDLSAVSAQAQLADLVAELDQRAASQHAPAVAGVTLASLHAAKGLEWDAVFLAGCSEGLLPISMAETPAAVEEERRLCYVGVTRARQVLQLSMARSRSAGGKATRRPSRFLDHLGSVLTTRGLDPRRPGTSTPGRAEGRRRSAAGRGPVTCRVCAGLLHSAAERKIGRCAGCPPGYDEAVFEALRAWRKAVASADSVPAFVVFTDATLIAIAEAAPRTVADLARISRVGPTKLDRYGAQVLAVLTDVGVVGPDPTSPGRESDGRSDPSGFGDCAENAGSPPVAE